MLQNSLWASGFRQIQAETLPWLAHFLSKTRVPESLSQLRLCFQGTRCKTDKHAKSANGFTPSGPTPESGVLPRWGEGWSHSQWGRETTVHTLTQCQGRTQSRWLDSGLNQVTVEGVAGLLCPHRQDQEGKFPKQDAEYPRERGGSLWGWLGFRFLTSCWEMNRGPLFSFSP